MYLLWLNKSLLALTKTELLQLLSSRPDIWEKALRRGKWVRRYGESGEREATAK